MPGSGGPCEWELLTVYRAAGSQANPRCCRTCGICHCGSTTPAPSHRAILLSPHLAGLRFLDLEYSKFTDATARMVAAKTSLTQLRRLFLGNERGLTDEGLRLMAASCGCPTCCNFSEARPYSDEGSEVSEVLLKQGRAASWARSLLTLRFRRAGGVSPWSGTRGLTPPLTQKPSIAQRNGTKMLRAMATKKQHDAEDHGDDAQHLRHGDEPTGRGMRLLSGETIHLQIGLLHSEVAQPEPDERGAGTQATQDSQNERCRGRGNRLAIAAVATRTRTPRARGRSSSTSRAAGAEAPLRPRPPHGGGNAMRVAPPLESPLPRRVTPRAASVRLHLGTTNRCPHTGHCALPRCRIGQFQRFLAPGASDNACHDGPVSRSRSSGPRLGARRVGKAPAILHAARSRGRVHGS
jgi:hypothetical protein